VYDQAEKAFAGKWVKWARRWSKASLADAKYIEELILQKLDAERMPQGDLKEDMNAVYAAIAAADFERVKDAMRVLDRKGLYGKPLEYALKGFEKASGQLVEDLEENFKLPRNAEDQASLKLGGGLTLGGFVGGMAVVKILSDISEDENRSRKYFPGAAASSFTKDILNKSPYIGALLGGSVMLAGLYNVYKGARRVNQRAQLKQAKAVYEYIRMRLDKVIPPTSVERHSGMVNQDALKDAIKASDFEKVQSVVWDLECSYLEPEAKQELINWAASYAAEILTKREEDLAYTGSWKKLKLDSLRRRPWQDTAKIAAGAAGVAWNVRSIVDYKGAFDTATYTLYAAIAGYIARDGWKRTTQLRQLNNAKEIKQLLRSKAN
jgi:hypothetical protein